MQPRQASPSVGADRQPRRPWWRALGLLMAVWLLAGCGEGGDATTAAGDGADDKHVIVASIHPLADLASQVAGPGFEVHTLLPPGASPHGFELTADRLRLLGRADLVLAVGLTLDPWADQAAARVSGELPVLHMAEMLDRQQLAAVPGALREGEAGDDHEGHDHEAHDHDHGSHAGPNDHLWLDPVLAKQWVTELRDELVERFPARAEAIQRNAAAVAASLDQLDRDYREQLAEVPRKELVTFHNAFDRLAYRYGLSVVAHLTDVDLEHGAEIRPERWRQAVAAVQQYELPVLYSEPQFSERELTSLQRETGADVLSLDPLGHPRRAGYRTYQEMMRSNLATLVDGQSQR